ncbi:MAG: phosphopantothenate/pantothenate synthetase [Candidatus Hodarchaeales archaeon]|jgi:4-phosphopantoate--beta-alanine ligase
MSNHEIPKDHPRYVSLTVRDAIISGMHQKVVAEAGLIAHGRGEAFDYLLGEETPNFALKQEEFAVLTILSSENPIISVNGNVAALCPEDTVALSKILNAPLEINLFYRSLEREQAIRTKLIDAGAELILGLDPEYQETIPEISHLRRIVDSRGIAKSDCVFVPLEDGDRTQALRRINKSVVTVDLNPLSRTSLTANVSITNNIIRAIPEMITIAEELAGLSKKQLEEQLMSFNNEKLLKKALEYMSERLMSLARVDKLIL